MGVFLPEEIVSYIMQFLSVSDRKVAMLVCRDWYSASLSPVLVADLVFTFHSWSAFDAALPSLQMRHGLNIVLDGIDNSILTRSLLTATSPDLFAGIRSLSLAGSDLTEGVFTSLLAGCNNLEVLDLSRCNALFMTGQLLAKSDDVERLKASLSSVRELCLASIRYISDAAFNRLVSVCSRLKRLRLAGNQIIFHTDVYFGSGKLADHANSAVLTFNNIMHFVKSNAAQLSTLDFSRTAINDNAILMLVNTPDLHLTELHMAHCQGLTDAGIVVLSKAQPGLHLLNISDCLSVRDCSLEAICTGLTQLRDLNLGKCRQLTDLSMCKLRSLRYLHRLDLNACYTVTSRGLALGLCSSMSLLGYLTSLTLACCSSVSDGFIVELTACLPNVTSLDLSSCGVSDTGVQAICSRLLLLRHLRLAWCQSITDNGLLGHCDANNRIPYCHNDGDGGLCKCTRRVQSLGIFHAPMAAAMEPLPQKTPASLDPVSIRPITNLRHLQLLDLTSCHRITDAGITGVMSSSLSFVELQSLHLSLCPLLTDVSLVAITAGLPSLEELHLAQCTRISDTGVVQLAEHLPRLSHLDLSCCDQLTNRTMDALYVNAKQLRRLDVSLCSGITAEAVEMLENRHEGHLIAVHKRHVGNTTVGIKA